MYPGNRCPDREYAAGAPGALPLLQSPGRMALLEASDYSGDLISTTAALRALTYLLDIASSGKKKVSTFTESQHLSATLLGDI